MASGDVPKAVIANFNKNAFLNAIPGGRAKLAEMQRNADLAKADGEESNSSEKGTGLDPKIREELLGKLASRSAQPFSSDRPPHHVWLDCKKETIRIRSWSEGLAISINYYAEYSILDKSAFRSSNYFCPVCGPLTKEQGTHTSKRSDGGKLSLKAIKTVDDLAAFEEKSNDQRRKIIALTIRALGNTYFEDKTGRLKTNLEKIFMHNWKHMITQSS